MLKVSIPNALKNFLSKILSSIVATGIVLIALLCSCQSRHKLFKEVPSEDSGITFSNDIKESDSLNVLNYEYLYNGGGVAIGDFNKDGLQDIYFTGNMTGNRLYLNRGHFKFRDITKESNTAGEGKWCSGVSVIDINNDGWPDIYACVTKSDDPVKRKNILYVNQGLDKNGIPVFKDEAAEYGLDDDSFSAMAAFFDYDNDGDLDMYLVISDKKVVKNFRNSGRRSVGTPYENTDKLFRNDWSDSLNHAVFSDVSKKAGITKEGYGLGVNITDVNEDGRPDIYVSNDYLSNDLLWINNGDGTFTDESGSYFRHTSFSSMGNDVLDLNNDGLNDFVTIDMLPHDNYRKKVMRNPNNYSNGIRHAFAGHDPEYTRNTLQLNQGRPMLENDSLGTPAFSEISLLSGIAATDWSWGVIGADFDNDGYRDLLITNGIPKDIRDLDFMHFRDQSGNVASTSMLISAIPDEKLANYIFRYNGNLKYTDESEKWGMKQLSYSNGAAWADLDNDGDLDLVINNIDDKASVYDNTENDAAGKSNHHWIEIAFKGNDKNTLGLGATADIYYDENHQTYYNTIYRGYLSSVQDMAHFGLDSTSVLDSVVVSWPNKKKQMWSDVAADQVLTADINNAKDSLSGKTEFISKLKSPAAFSDVTHKSGVHYVQREKSYDNYKVQTLLPHKFSKYGPGLAVGDVDGNGLDDIFIGGSLNHKGIFLLQQPDGKFVEKDLLPGAGGVKKTQEDEGVLLFDADNDGDPDLYIVSGSVENPTGSSNYQDRLYLNDGHGNFIYDSSALPQFHTSGSCVIASDYDHDGDLDLFVGGRVIPGKYPAPVPSYILRNDSQNGYVMFTDVTSSIAPMLKNIGLVTDALWTDFNNDGWPDLVICGEWMPITFLENQHGTFVNVTDQSGISDQVGWWNSLVAGDFDNDGDIDYIAGNLGLNSLYKASKKRPVGIYANDFAGSGIYVAIPTIYFPDAKGDYKEYPAQGRDDLYRELLLIGKNYPKYSDFAKATIHDIFSNEDLKGALIYHADNLQTCYIENLGGGKFRIKPLPIQAQFAPVFGMQTGDFNVDGNLDVVLNGNEFGTEAQIGNYDAFNGLLLDGNGKGGFKAESLEESGIYIPGDGKALVGLVGADGHQRVVASQNAGPLKIFRVNHDQQIIKLGPADAYALLHLKNGKTRKQEFYYGSSFLSASGRFLVVPPQAVSVEIVDIKGYKRSVSMN